MMKRNKEAEIKYSANDGYIRNTNQIPARWAIKRFADITDYRAGRTPARANTDYWSDMDDGVPWVTIADMSNFGTVTDTKERISKIAVDRVFRGQIVPAGTLIMSFKLTIGRIATLGIDALHNEAIIAIFPKRGIDQRYLGYFLSQVDYNSLQDRQVKGNTLNREKIDRIEIWVPPLVEQIFIANILEIVQKAKELEAKCKQTAQDLKLSVMRVLFKQGLRNEPQKETAIGPIPESWKVMPLGALCVKTDTINFQHENKRIIEYVDVSSVSRESLQIESTSQFILKEAPGRARKHILDGDVIFATVRPTLLRTAIVPPQLNNQVCSTAFCVLRRIPKKVTDKFIYYLVQREQFVQQLAQIETGASYPAVTDRIVKEQPVPVPTMNEQQEIVKMLETIDYKIDLHQRKYSVLNALFQSLLHKLLIGEIRADDLDLGDENEDLGGASGKNSLRRYTNAENSDSKPSQQRPEKLSPVRKEEI